MAQLNACLSEILASLREGKTLTSDQWQQLAVRELEDERRVRAFSITRENVAEIIKERGHLFQACSEHLLAREGSEKQESSSSLLTHKSSLFLETLWNLWLPLAIQIASYRQALERPLIQGILGVQGTGKTTLANILTFILSDRLGYRTTSLSLDDLYKTYAERQALREQDPRLVWRGPPGTHDIELGVAVLDRLRRKEPKMIQVPRFDKSAWGGAGDRTQPAFVENADIVLFEGWFVGVRPIDPDTFDTAPPPIVTQADRSFARDMNAHLKNYLPLWERLDRLMVLYPVDYRSSLTWRRQAERQMIASGLPGMTDLMVEQFVEYFWRSLHPELFIKPLAHNSELVDLVVEIQPDRSVGAVYQPSH